MSSFLTLPGAVNSREGPAGSGYPRAKRCSNAHSTFQEPVNQPKDLTLKRSAAAAMNIGAVDPHPIPKKIKNG
ncbi:MAG: hypothetical protein JRI79_06510 [Deltaproteobacteria bacterium]|nr:hypothetical protein [Deltaproteobacteria bacterium]MBW1977604.1 hypothetical protein [Deltaproteobacteria bacterium]